MTVPFRHIYGQERIVETLRRLLANGHVATTYLFDGPEGVGKTLAAKAFICALFCQHRQSKGDACGVCASCRKMASGNHPDFHCLEPLPDKRDISIEQVRLLQQALALRPLEAPRNACIIEPADRLNEKSANALLKTLEEPPGDALLILITTQGDRLLPTIRSRTQQFRFALLSDAVLMEIAAQQGLNDLTLDTVSLAEGSITRLASLVGLEEQQARRTLLSVLSGADRLCCSSILQAVEEHLPDGREEALLTAERFISLLEDLCFLCAADNHTVKNHSCYEGLRTEAARFNQHGAMLALELALDCHRALRGNVNIRLCFERFLIEYDRLRKGVDP